MQVILKRQKFPPSNFGPSSLSHLRRRRRHMNGSQDPEKREVRLEFPRDPVAYLERQERVHAVPVHGPAGVHLGRRDLQNVGDFAHKRVDHHLCEARRQRCPLLARGSSLRGDVPPHGQRPQTPVGRLIGEAESVGGDEVLGAEAGAYMSGTGVVTALSTVSFALAHVEGGSWRPMPSSHCERLLPTPADSAIAPTSRVMPCLTPCPGGS